MSRIYEDGRLIRIECDAHDDGHWCTAFITPRPDIAKSGWMAAGIIGEPIRWHYCPEHAAAALFA